MGLIEEVAVVIRAQLVTHHVEDSCGNLPTLAQESGPTAARPPGHSDPHCQFIRERRDKALAFYIGVLGFTKAADIDMGPLRWLTVTSPEAADGVELLLEKMDFRPSQIYRQARLSSPLTAGIFSSTGPALA
jgi:hypothetical protein